jgi:hypothetical protein
VIVQVTRIASLLVVSIALITAPVQAQTLADDAKCLLVSGLFAKSSDAKTKQAGAETRLFYLGRLNGSPDQMESAIRAQAKTITQQNAGATMRVCAMAVAEKANQVEAIGRRLSKQKNVP